MNKKVYLQPAIEATEFDMNEQLLANSVTGINTTGLDDNLEKDESSGSSWDEAMSRSAWDDEEDF